MNAARYFPHVLLFSYFVSTVSRGNASLSDALIILGLIALTGLYEWKIRSAEVNSLEKKFNDAVAGLIDFEQRIKNVEGSISTVKVSMGMNTRNVKNQSNLR